MRVLHVVPSYYPATRYGGPIFSIHQMCCAQARAGMHVEVATTDANGRTDLDVPLGRLVALDNVGVRYFHREPRIDFALSVGLLRFLGSELPTFDVVHIHSVFSYPTLAACEVCRRKRVPYVLSPHGALQAWGMRQGAWRKQTWWNLFERAHARNSAFLHATSPAEADDLFALAPDARIFVAPNGIDPPNPLPAVEVVPGRVLFLGRIHAVKGLDLALEAMRLVTIRMPQAELVIAGPDQGARAGLLEHLRSLSPRPNVVFSGEVHGPAKWKLLSSAEVFVLPSLTENFGQVVIEALSTGTPAVAAYTTPWKALEEARAGRWVPREAGRFAEAILEILGASDAEKGVRRAAARQLAARYSSAASAATFAKFYGLAAAHDRDLT